MPWLKAICFFLVLCCVWQNRRDESLTIACMPSKRLYVVQLYGFFSFLKIWPNNTIDTIGAFHLPAVSKRKSWSLEYQSTILWLVKLSRYIQQLQKNDRTKLQTSHHCFFPKLPKKWLQNDTQLLIKANEKCHKLCVLQVTANPGRM